MQDYIDEAIELQRIFISSEILDIANYLTFRMNSSAVYPIVFLTL